MCVSDVPLHVMDTIMRQTFRERGRCGLHTHTYRTLKIYVTVLLLNKTLFYIGRLVRKSIFIGAELIRKRKGVEVLKFTTDTKVADVKYGLCKWVMIYYWCTHTQTHTTEINNVPIYFQDRLKIFLKLLLIFN